MLSYYLYGAQSAILAHLRSQKLTFKLIDSVVSVIGRGEKTCVVIIEEHDTDNYAIGGETVSEIRKKSS